MGKVVEKKKKGRPSLLDLQKRTLKQKQPQQQHQQQLDRNNSAPNSHPNYRTTPAPLRRSARRNPNLDDVFPENLHNHNHDGDELSIGKRREKKLKFVLKLPSQGSSLNSASSNSCGSDSNVEDNTSASNNKKRKINAIGDVSVPVDSDDKDDKSISGINPSKTPEGTQLDAGPSTLLPDKKLLLFILDRLQKKDTYGVFSEPVDPNELPDYHEVIEHPMDFGTVRKKLDDGAYANLEQLEKDVFLICSNAMQYNAPDTIYFRQARSIQELARRSFENLRQDSDDNEPEPRIVRRGRPPTKNLKKPSVKPSLEHAGSEFSSDATLATGGENNTWSNCDLRKGLHVLQRSALADLSGRSHVVAVARNNDFCSSLLAENKSEKIDDFTGSMLRGNTIKYGKKQFVLDENRRNTYKLCHPSTGEQETSVLNTFDGEKKLLLPVGLHSEYGYARSLAQSAANLGPVGWKIASERIERCLPTGIKFGPGWVGENDIIKCTSVPGPSPASALPSPLQHFSSQSSLSASVLGKVELKNDSLPEKPDGNILSDKLVSSIHTPPNGHLTKPVAPCFIPSSSSVANRSSELIAGKAEANGGFNSHMGSKLQSSSITVTRPRTPLQVHPSPALQPGMNGLSLASHLGKLTGVSQRAGINLHSSSMMGTLFRSNNNFAHPAPTNSMKSGDAKLAEKLNVSSSCTLANSRSESLLTPMPGHHSAPSWQPYQKSISGLPPHQKPESVPPDLNVRFQAPASPNSGRVDSTPDLALQL